MPISLVEIDKMLIWLAETPHRMVLITSGCDKEQLHAKPNNDSWSVNDNLAHLRSCADVWGKSILVMIAEDRPILRYISPRTWIKKTEYPTQEFHLSLRAFTNQRDELLQSLQRLQREDWARGAIFIDKKKEREQTIFDYARRLAIHERQHLEQIEQILTTMNI